jgi:hypothetical protein
MRTDYIVTKFLADTNKNIKKVVEAEKPDDVVDVLNKVSLAEAMYILPMTKMYHSEFTETAQLITGDFSVAVLAEFDDEFLVFKYDEDRNEWMRDSRFGMYGRIDYDGLHEISYACDELVAGCDAYVNGVKGMKDELEREHEKAVLISEVVGFDRAMEMFTRAVEFSRIQVVKAEKAGRNTLGVVTLERESTGRRFCVGKDE